MPFQSTIKVLLFENMVIGEKVKQNYHRYLQQELYYCRDSNGNEVDLLILNEEGIDIYEIKATETITTKLFESLHKFEQMAGDRLHKKVLVYAGVAPQQRSYAEVRSWLHC
jgi:predicted AAA+ superfamily ATPase